MPADLKFNADAAIDRLMRFLAIEGVTGKEKAVAAAVAHADGQSNRQATRHPTGAAAAVLDTPGHGAAWGWRSARAQGQAHRPRRPDRAGW